MIRLGPFAIEDMKIIVSLLLGFVLIVLLLVKVNVPYLSLPYFRDVLNERAGRIENNHNQVANQLAEVRRVRDEYAARLQQIETETRERIDSAVRDAENARAEIIAEAQQAALAVRRRAEEEIGRERTRQRIQIRQEIVQIALDAAEQAVRANNSDAVQRQLIRDFVSQAGADSRSAAATPVSSPAQLQAGA